MFGWTRTSIATGSRADTILFDRTSYKPHVQLTAISVSNPVYSRRCFLSAFRPAPHHSGFSRSAARSEHFGDVQMTAEANKVVAPLQIGLPAAHTRVVAEKRIAFQGGCETNVMTVKGARVPQHRLVGRPAFVANGLRRRRHQAVRVRPPGGQRRS